MPQKRKMLVKVYHLPADASRFARAGERSGDKVCTFPVLLAQNMVETVKRSRKMAAGKNIFWTWPENGCIIYPIMEQYKRCSGSIKMR